MKKYKWVLITVMTFALGYLSWLVIKNQNPKSTIDTSDRQFAIPEIEQVEKIFLSHRAYQPITLEKKDGIWYVNERYKAYPGAIENLLFVMKNMRIQSITPRNSHEFVMKSVANFGIKVEAYGRENVKLRSYYVTAATNDEHGVYCIMENAAQSYIMELKNLNSNIRHRFDLTLNDWRDRTIADINNKEINKVKVEYPHFEDTGFIIKMDQGSLKLLDHNSKPTDGNVKQNAMQYFWDQVQKLHCESIRNNDSIVNALKAIKPWAVVSYELKERDPLILQFYALNEQKDNMLDLSMEFLLNGPFFRLFVLRNDGELFMVQIQQVQQALKKRRDFYY